MCLVGGSFVLHAVVSILVDSWKEVLHGVCWQMVAMFLVPSESLVDDE